MIKGGDWTGGEEEHIGDCILVPHIYFDGRKDQGILGATEARSSTTGGTRETHKHTRERPSKIELGGYRYNAASRHLIQVLEIDRAIISEECGSSCKLLVH